MIIPVGRVSLRPAEADDEPLLREVYAAGRAEELAPVPWSAVEKRQFLDSQFDLQDSAYRAAYPDGRFLVVEEDGEPIGRLYLGDLPGELRVIDIGLLPHARGRGLGTTLLEGVLAEASSRGRSVTLHVERWNPAWRLYERLGFVEVPSPDDGGGAYVKLRRD